MAHDAAHDRPLQDGELPVEHLGPGVHALLGAQGERRAVDRGVARCRCDGCTRAGADRGDGRDGGTTAEDVVSEDRHEDPHLLDEVVHVRGVGLRELRPARWLLDVRKRPAAHTLGDHCEPGLEVADVRTRQVRVLGRHDHDLIPEVLLRVVVPETLGHVIALADVREAIALGPGAEEDVDPGTSGFGARADLAQLQALALEDVAGPVADLGRHQPTDTAVHEIQAHLFAGHAAVSSLVGLDHATVVQVCDEGSRWRLSQRRGGPLAAAPPELYCR